MTARPPRFASSPLGSEEHTSSTPTTSSGPQLTTISSISGPSDGGHGHLTTTSSSSGGAIPGLQHTMGPIREEAEVDIGPDDADEPDNRYVAFGGEPVSQQAEPEAEQPAAAPRPTPAAPPRYVMPWEGTYGTEVTARFLREAATGGTRDLPQEIDNYNSRWVYGRDFDWEAPGDAWGVRIPNALEEAAGDASAGWDAFDEMFADERASDAAAQSEEPANAGALAQPSPQPENPRHRSRFDVYLEKHRREVDPDFDPLALPEREPEVIGIGLAFNRGDRPPRRYADDDEDFVERPPTPPPPKPQRPRPNSPATALSIIFGESFYAPMTGPGRR
ncbi:hypothetical protein L596_012086 [Steinernema carpocapsae]|uniref:Uncharacterized protein n=1 Tax=Steinernema carpocapsae TaxID=34508 RepID=A0A4U5NWW4_STECR|nr:hypothetical protein L596_012086 [Steinernema carpocapsae]